MLLCDENLIIFGGNDLTKMIKNKKVFYIVGAVLLGFYAGEDEKILNFPFRVNVMLYAGSLAVTLGYFHFSNRKKAGYSFVMEFLSSLAIAFALFLMIRFFILIFILLFIEYLHYLSLLSCFFLNYQYIHMIQYNKYTNYFLYYVFNLTLFF